jgi:hypothetical protein
MRNAAPRFPVPLEPVDVERQDGVRFGECLVDLHRLERRCLSLAADSSESAVNAIRMRESDIRQGVRSA